MHKVSTILATTILSFLLLPQQVAAQLIPEIQNPVEYDTAEEILERALSLIQPLIIIVLLGVITYGGFVYLTAGDNDEKVGKAKKIIIAGIVGFIIIILAPVIVQFVGALFGVRDIGV